MKNSVNRILVLLTLVALMSACATPYQGPPPNLTAKGKDAQIEVDHFSMGESFWVQSANGIHMGPQSELYTNSSVKPIIEQISPVAKAKLDRADNVYLWSLITLGLALGSLVVASSTNNIGTQNGWAGVGLVSALTSIGLSLGGIDMRSGAIKQYNRDLRERLNVATPSAL